MDDLERAAIHEAGHALAYRLLFEKVYPEGVSIEPDDNEGSLGRFTPSVYLGEVSEDASEAEAETQFMAYAVCCCAGYAALIAAGYSRERAEEGTESDFQATYHRLDAAKREAVTLMSEERNTNAVRLIADELMRLRTIDGEHAEVLMDYALGEISESEYLEFLNLRRLLQR